MASVSVEIEFFSVIVRKAQLAAAYPGGLDAFCVRNPNNLEDEHLAKVGFMGGSDADTFIAELETHGLRCSETSDSDIAFIFRASDAPLPAWLTIGEHEGAACAWHRDFPPGALIKFEALLARTSKLEHLEEAVTGCGATMQLQQETAICRRGGASLELTLLWQDDLKNRQNLAANFELTRDLREALDRMLAPGVRPDFSDGSRLGVGHLASGFSIGEVLEGQGGAGGPAPAEHGRRLIDGDADNG